MITLSLKQYISL